MGRGEVRGVAALAATGIYAVVRTGGAHRRRALGGYEQGREEGREGRRERRER